MEGKSAKSLEDTGPKIHLRFFEENTKTLVDTYVKCVDW
jgi:hypothetical protein